MNARRQSGAGPLVVLTIAALIPALLLWAIWRWADGEAAAADDAVPETDSSVSVAAEPGQPALSTGLPLRPQRRPAWV